MKELSQLKEGLYGIEVPEDAKDIDIKSNTVFYWQCDNIIARTIYLPEGDWKILGTASKDKISFDVAPYFKTEELPYKAYPIGHKNYSMRSTPIELFYSLLNSKGYYWKNPMGEKPTFSYSDYIVISDGGLSENQMMSIEHDFEERIQRWHSFQDKLLTGLILLIEKVN